MNLPLVSVIIVNWNGKEVLKDCLESLQSLKYPEWELILVDNGSTDGSDQLVNQFKLKAKRVEIITNNSNVGFAKANNQGFEKSKGKYILFLNNDTKVTPEFLDLMVKKMETEKEIGAMQPKIHILDNPKYLDNAGTFLTSTGFLEHWGYMQKDSKEFDQEKIIFSAKGACLLTRREIIQKIGLFDDIFGSYFEESDFCWRVWLSGWKVLYYPKAKIYHKVGFTSKKMSQIQVNYDSLKNRIFSFFKNLEFYNLFLILFPHIIIILGVGLYYLLRLQIKKAKMMFSPILWNIKNFDKLIRGRKNVQKLRRISDHEIFKYVMHKTDLAHLFSHFLKVEANFK